MKRLILLALISIPLALLAVDRLSAPRHPRPEDETARLAFDFPAPPNHRPHPRHGPHHPPRPHHHEARAEATEPEPSVKAVRTITSDLMANEDRALANLRVRIDAAVADWLADAGVPRTWQAPRFLVDRLVQAKPEVFLAARRDYGDLYQAEVPVAFTRESKARIVAAYRSDLSSQRMSQLGAVFAFILACLAILAGYVRTDEATRGYYTNRLRLLAAAALGASGVVLYQFLTA